MLYVYIAVYVQNFNVSDYRTFLNCSCFEYIELNRLISASVNLVNFYSNVFDSTNLSLELFIWITCEKFTQRKHLVGSCRRWTNWDFENIGHRYICRQIVYLKLRRFIGNFLSSTLTIISTLLCECTQVYCFNFMSGC